MEKNVFCSPASGVVPEKEGPVILLSNNDNSLPLLEWLKKRVEVIYYGDKMSVSMIDSVKPSLVISYNYRHIIKPEIISALHGNIINLHISLLPWNRGSSPNIWSFIYDTPKGVTIHVLDEGLDTGDILLQKKLVFDEEKETLKSSYDILNREIVQLLQDNWEYIYSKKWHPQKQIGAGSVHNMRDLQDYLKERVISYDMTIAEFKRRFVPKG